MENDLAAKAEVVSVKTVDKSAKYGYAMIALLFLGWMLGGFDRTVINFSVIYIAKDFGINATQQGLVLSAFSSGSGNRISREVGNQQSQHHRGGKQLAVRRFLPDGIRRRGLFGTALRHTE